jgi:hypothetical protein
VTNWKAFVAVIGVVAGLSACADFDIACEPVTPTVLPDGSNPGQPVTDRSLGAEMLLWGSEQSAVREAVIRMHGESFVALERTPGLLVRGYPAEFRHAAASPYNRPGIIWQQAVCQYEIWLDPSLSDDESIDYAGRI